MHIARNTIGNVVFRESSEKALKRAIDDSLKTTTPVIDEEIKIEESTPESIPEEILNNNREEILVPTQKRVTRGPDGKFISKSQLDLEEEEKKKTFWDKLTS